jgi:hypothetical protein
MSPSIVIYYHKLYEKKTVDWADSPSDQRFEEGLAVRIFNYQFNRFGVVASNRKGDGSICLLSLLSSGANFESAKSIKSAEVQCSKF